MAFDISTIKAKAAPTPHRTMSGTDDKTDPSKNPWLSKDWDQGLWASYQNDEAYGADFPGEIVQLPASRGKVKGELIDKVQGDAADAEGMIRKAAELLGIGASIRVKQAMHGNGNPRKGYLHVVWYGKTPKQTKKLTGKTAPAAETTLPVEE